MLLIIIETKNSFKMLIVFYCLQCNKTFAAAEQKKIKGSNKKNIV